MTDVKNKWVLVTGASRGIGREIALFMAKQGANLVLHSRNIDGTKDLEAEIRAMGVDVCSEACELEDLDDTAAFAQRVIDRVQVDILFNNAAIQLKYQNPYYVVNVPDYIRSYKVNVIAPMLLIEKFIPAMLAQDFGRIINVTSGIKNLPAMGDYAATKGALDKLTTDFAYELEGKGVSISAVDPGWIQTDLGGPNAPNTLDTVLPGMVLGAFAGGSVNGKILSAQDYKGQTLEAALACV